MIGLPPELTCKVITRVIAQSVHSICLSSESVEWELGAIRTLCSVSFSFRNITLELARKAFEVGPEIEPSHIISHLSKMLNHLRSLGIRLRNPSEFLSPPISYEEVWLVFGYSMYLAAVTLRYGSVGSGVELFQKAHATIFTSLRAILVICDRVQPPEMASFLRRGVEEEILITECELATVQAAIKLGVCINSWTALQESIEDDIVRRRMILRTEMDENLAMIEKADGQSKIVRCVTRIHPSAKLPEVENIIKSLKGIELDIDEYGIPLRLESLTARWGLEKNC